MPASYADHVRRGLEELVEPGVAELLLHRVGSEPLAEVTEVDRVEILILVEAGEDDALFAGVRVLELLQALRADLLHHALHRRVDAPDREVPRVEQRRE